MHVTAGSTTNEPSASGIQSQIRSETEYIGWLVRRIGTTGWFRVSRAVESKKAAEHPLCRKKPGADWKRTCKLAAQEESHKKGPRWSWTRNQMGNVSLIQFSRHIQSENTRWGSDRGKSRADPNVNWD